jgi:hypothetical protein
MAVNLSAYHTVALAANTPTQLVVPGGGHCTLNILNLGTGNLFISSTNTPAANSNSFKLPTGTTIVPIPIGPGGVWVAADAAGSISVAVIPRL